MLLSGYDFANIVGMESFIFNFLPREPHGALSGDIYRDTQRCSNISVKNGGHQKASGIIWKLRVKDALLSGIHLGESDAMGLKIQ